MSVLVLGGKYAEGAYSYEGDWHEDQMHGSGAFCFASGNCYQGEFKMNVYHGQGTFKWANGTSYTVDIHFCHETIRRGAISGVLARWQDAWSGKLCRCKGEKVGWTILQWFWSWTRLQFIASLFYFFFLPFAFSGVTAGAS